jgi:hypothetical protein
MDFRDKPDRSGFLYAVNQKTIQGLLQIMWQI